jgi:hydroxymethylbilane synthase
MGWKDRVSQILPPETILHAVGQGSLAVECREGDDDILSKLQKLEHTPTALRCIAERGFMRSLEGGCSVPLGVWSEYKEGPDGSKSLYLKGSVTSVDGSEDIRDQAEVALNGGDVASNKATAENLGVTVGQMLIKKGAKRILDEIRRQ